MPAVRRPPVRPTAPAGPPDRPAPGGLVVDRLRAAADQPALTWRAAPGELVALLGPAGTHRRALLDCLAGATPPVAGTVRLAGAPPRPEQVGLLPRRDGLVAHLSAMGNVRLAQWLRQPPPGSLASPVDLVRRVGLADRTDRATCPARHLGPVDAVRARAAVALAGAPRLVIAEDPTADLAADDEQAVLRLLVRLARRGPVIVVATSRPAVGRRADRLVPMPAPPSPPPSSGGWR